MATMAEKLAVLAGQADTSSADNKAKKMRNIYIQVAGATLARIEVWDKPMREGNNDLNAILAETPADELSANLGKLLGMCTFEVKDLQQTRGVQGDADDIAEIAKLFAKAL
jgi:hypothetical protein